MNTNSYIVVTNNPLVKERLGETHNVEYIEVSYEELLKAVRDKIHAGHKLLSHPLSGSVKPKETPYKSVMVSEAAGKMDMHSLSLIEYALQTCEKFVDRTGDYAPEVYEDFKMIDCSLLESGLPSADFWR